MLISKNESEILELVGLSALFTEKACSIGAGMEIAVYTGENRMICLYLHRNPPYAYVYRLITREAGGKFFRQPFFTPPTHTAAPPEAAAWLPCQPGTNRITTR